MDTFTPLASLAGGALIGLSAALMLLFHGRIAGISGIAGGLLSGPPKGDVLWRALFVAGLVGAGAVAARLAPAALEVGVERPTAALVIAGLLVGFGTRLGNGCTSGHGVCGLSRMSPRSLVATLSFMAAGVATATIAGRLLWGAS